LFYGNLYEKDKTEFLGNNMENLDYFSNFPVYEFKISPNLKAGYSYVFTKNNDNAK